MKVKFNDYGKGSYEFLTVAVVCLILSAILLFIVVNNNNREKLQVFKYNAKIVGINAVNYNNKTSEEVIYLYELIDENLVTNIKNNFSGTNYCDSYESKVVFDGKNKKVTLKCGNYLIYNQDVTDDSYDIYKVSDWTFAKMYGNNIDTNVVYGLFKDGKNLLNKYYEKDLFIKLVSKKYGSKYHNMKVIEDDFKVVSKKIYRKRTLVR